MAHIFQMQANGILHVTLSGDFTEDELEDYLTQLKSYIEPLSADERLVSFMDATELQNVSPNARRAINDFVTDPRFGKTAAFGKSRFVKVWIDFVMRASGRDHIRYFTDKTTAMDWLSNHN